MRNNIAIPVTTSSLIILLQLSLAILGLWLLLHSWSLTSIQGQQLLSQQSRQMMREMLQILSHTAAYLIENDQLDGLAQLTRHISASSQLYDAVIYDANGVRISWSEHSEAAHILYAPSYQEVLLPMVQEISRDQQLLGYIKCSLRLDASLNAIEQHWQQFMQQILGMLLLAAAVTFFFKRSLNNISTRVNTL